MKERYRIYYNPELDEIVSLAPGDEPYSEMDEVLEHIDTLLKQYPELDNNLGARLMLEEMGKHPNMSLEEIFKICSSLIHFEVRQYVGGFIKNVAPDFEMETVDEELP